MPLRMASLTLQLDSVVAILQHSLPSACSWLLPRSAEAV
jgi:hypothetical protein